MRNLGSYLHTPFDDRNISMAELASFATDHLERLIANNPNGVLSSRITATSPAVAALDEAFDDDTVRLGQRKGRKLAKNHFRASLAIEVGKIYGAIIAEYGEGSPDVVECLPGGRTAIGRASDDQLDTYLHALVQGIEARVDTLGSALLARATDLEAAWLAIYAASESATGAKSSTEEQKRAVRATLQWTLYENIWAIARLYPRQPQRLALYMKPHLLGMPQDFGGGGGSGGGGGGGGDDDDDSSSSSSSPSSSSSSSSSSPSSSSSSSSPSSSSSSSSWPSSSSSSSSSWPSSSSSSSMSSSSSVSSSSSA